jgi:hypothetical protein
MATKTVPNAADRMTEELHAAWRDSTMDSANNLWDAVALLKALQARIFQMENAGAIHIDERTEIGRSIHVAQGLIEREASKLPDLCFAPQGARQ